MDDDFRYFRWRTVVQTPLWRLDVGFYSMLAQFFLGRTA